MRLAFFRVHNQLARLAAGTPGSPASQLHHVFAALNLLCVRCGIAAVWQAVGVRFICSSAMLAARGDRAGAY